VDTKVLKDIEDRLMAGLKLDAYERSLYYLLARHTRAEGKESALFSVAGLAERLGISHTAVRRRIRSMNKKGCIKIEER
jgi:DNA-binding Lrp family transcriptional regulator